MLKVIDSFQAEWNILVLLLANEYLVSTVGTDVQVLGPRGISSPNTEYAAMHFHPWIQLAAIYGLIHLVSS